jgi:signal transduction histidine kinase
MENGRGPAAFRSFDAGRIETLRAELAAHDLDRHLALFYDSPGEQLRAGAAFCKHALSNGRKCLYLTDVNTATDIERSLSAAGVDVDARRAAGDLSIRDAGDVYLGEGFDPDGMLRTLESACEASLREGYDGFSVAGENTWCFHTDEAFDHVLRFEAGFDSRCPDLPVTALCQYDLSSFSEESVAKALWTHRQIVYRGRICENPYYVPPEEYTEDADRQLSARLMLEQTHSLAAARRRIEEHEQRLSVINRILRHNIRNELNVVLGNLDLLADSIDSDLLADAKSHARRVVDLAERARYVETTLSDPTIVPTDIGAVVESVIERLRREYPDVRFEVDRDRGGQVEGTTAMAITDLDVAVSELATNAVEHQESGDRWVAFSLFENGGSAVLEVENPGDPIPAVDRLALTKGQETPLQHGRGLGLWIVKWLVESSHGTVRFRERSDRSSVVVELPATDRRAESP